MHFPRLTCCPKAHSAPQVQLAVATISTEATKTTRAKGQGATGKRSIEATEFEMPKTAFRLNLVPVDRTLVIVCFLLFLISITLIASASVQEAFISTGDPYYYVKRQLIFIAVSIVWGLLMSTIPSKTWYAVAPYLMIFTIFLLILLLIVGREINYATRWIDLGPVNFQPAELLKVAWVLYFSRYVCLKINNLRNSFVGFLKPMGFIAIVAFLLLLQPDFGSLAVVTAISFGLLFVAGAGLLKYLLILGVVGLVGAGLVWLQPYRMARVLSFLDPWQDPFGEGYQLTQSLMAFGRGGLSGEGIGNSIQKLGYLPEAHTDFVMAIMGEECGFIGLCVVILLEFILVFKALFLSFKILRQRSQFQGYVAFGLGMFFCLQTFINIGAATGGLPPKGLTLPLISYGGSSLVMCSWAIGILLRIDFEWRHRKLGDLRYD